MERIINHRTCQFMVWMDIAEKIRSWKMKISGKLTWRLNILSSTCVTWLPVSKIQLALTSLQIRRDPPAHATRGVGYTLVVNVHVKAIKIMSRLTAFKRLAHSSLSRARVRVCVCVCTCMSVTSRGQHPSWFWCKRLITIINLLLTFVNQGLCDDVQVVKRDAGDGPEVDGDDRAVFLIGPAAKRHVKRLLLAPHGQNVA